MSQGKRRAWPDKDNQRLISLWDSVGSVALIALNMNRTMSSVQTQASRLNLPPRTEQGNNHRRRWHEDDDIELDEVIDELQLSDGRIPIKTLSDRMKRSVDAIVARLITRFGEEETMGRLVAPAIDEAAADATLSQERGEGVAGKKGKMKNCLKCRKSFWSEGSHNWVCSSCKKTAEWTSDY